MLIFFDIDDTLLDHRAAMLSGATRLHESMGLPVSLEEFLGRWQRALDHHYARYLAGQVSFHGQRRDRVKEVIDSSLSDGAADSIFEQYVVSYEASWSLFPDVLPCLDGLSRHCLGVISNGHGLQQRKKLAKTGILHRFDYVVISEEYGCTKPDTMIFAQACYQVGEPPENAAYVGDQYELDAEAARTAGMKGIWLDRHQQATAEHSPPIIESLTQLKALLPGKV